MQDLTPTPTRLPQDLTLDFRGEREEDASQAQGLSFGYTSSKLIDGRFCCRKHVEAVRSGHDSKVLKCPELPGAVCRKPCCKLRVSNAIEATAPQSVRPSGFADEITFISVLVRHMGSEGHANQSIRLVVPEQHPKSLPIVDYPFNRNSDHTTRDYIPQFEDLMHFFPQG